VADARVRNSAGGMCVADTSVWNSAVGVGVADDCVWNDGSSVGSGLLRRTVQYGMDEADLLSVTDIRALICIESAVYEELTDIRSVIWAKALDFCAFLLE